MGEGPLRRSRRRGERGNTGGKGLNHETQNTKHKARNICWVLVVMCYLSNMAEENKNPFSNEDMSGSQNPDFGVNQFSTEQTSFPQFGNPQGSQTAKPMGGFADEKANDIRDRIESAKSNGWGAQFAGIAGSHKKKILVVATIALLFLGGSYMSNRNSQENVPLFGPADISDSVSTLRGNTATGIQDADGDTVNILDIKINDEGEVIFPDAEVDGPEFRGSSITKTASPGEGITHLARSALKDYLADTAKTLSAEQKIYAEDYVQNQIGSEFLEVGQKLSFSKDLLSEAVAKSEQLEDWQIENLTQYTANVSLL